MTARGLLLGAAGALALATPAQSATVAISLTLPAFAQVTGLSDVSFTNVSASTDAVNSQGVCVYSSSLTRSYTVTATGSGAGSAFLLANGGATVPYSVGWAGAAGSSSTTALVAGMPSAAFTGGALLPACTGGAATNSTLKITIVTSDLQSMLGGITYTGTLTLLITPV